MFQSVVVDGLTALVTIVVRTGVKCQCTFGIGVAIDQSYLVSQHSSC